jgi:hypothetical protein
MHVCTASSHPREILAPWKYQSPVRMTTLVRFLKIVTMGTASALSDRKPVISIAQKSMLTGSQSIATSLLKRFENLTTSGSALLAAKRQTSATEFCTAQRADQFQTRCTAAGPAQQPGQGRGGRRTWKNSSITGKWKSYCGTRAVSARRSG